MTIKIRKRTGSRFIAAVAACLSITLAAAQAASAHGSYPAHDYSASCQASGWITATPIQVETQPGVGLSIIDGSGISSPTTHQYIYFRVWRYSYRLGQWRAGAYKRLFNGTPGTAEIFNSRLGGWAFANGMLYADSFNLNPDFDFFLGTQQVGVPGDWGLNYTLVETYWEPPTTTWNMTDPNPPAGGTRHYEPGGYCYFS
jgi:hypothetical protein